MQIRRVLLLLLLVLLAALAGLLAWLATPTGVGWALQRVPGLEVNGLTGSPFGGSLAVQRIHWRASDGALEVTVQGLVLHAPRWAWRPHAGAWVGLQAPRASAERVDIRSRSSSASAAPPPTTLRLPLQAELAQLSVALLQVNTMPPVRELRAQVSLGADGGRVHRVQGLQLALPTLRLAGSAQVNADAPLATTLALQATGQGWAGQAKASGPLAQLAAQLTLRGQAAGGAELALDASATVQPFAPWPLAALALRSHALDLSRLAAGAPRTALDIQATLDTRGLDQPMAADLSVRNRQPGAWDQGLLPLATLVLQAGAASAQAAQVDIRRFEATLAGAAGEAGRVSGQGRWSVEALALQTQWQAVQPARLHGAAPPLELAGPVSLTLTGLPGPQQLQQSAAATASAWALATELDLKGRALQGPALPWLAQGRLRLSAAEVEVPALALRAGPTTASLQGRLRRPVGGRWQMDGQARWQQLDPLAWWPQAPAAWRQSGPHRASGQLKAALQLQPPPPGAAAPAWLRALQGQAELVLGEGSQLAGVPLAGQATLRTEAGAVALQAQAQAAGNTARLAGRWPLVGDGSGDSTQIELQAPALAALAPWQKLLPGTPWPAAGELQASTQVLGRWPTLQSEGQARLRGWRLADAQLGAAELRWRVGSAANAQWDLQLQAQDLRQGPQRIQRLDASVQGTRDSHRLQASLDSSARPPTWTEALLGPAGEASRAELQAQGRWQPGSAWSWADGRLRIAAKGGAQPWLDAPALAGALRLDASGRPQALELAPGRALLPGGAALRWQQASWQLGSGALALNAELEALAVAPLLARLQPELGWGGDLRVGATLVLKAQQAFEADLVFERLGGDLLLRDEAGTSQALGLTDLRLGLAARDGVWQFTQGVAGKQLGEMGGAQVLRTGDPRARWPAPNTPLDGVLELRVANLGAWGTWVPPGWRLGGQLRVGAAFGGRFGAPELRGEMQGSGLAVRNLLEGVNWSDGTLSATLQGEQVRIEAFGFKGGEGRLTVTGGGTLGATPGATLRLAAERFRVLGRIDRRLVASGSAELKLGPERLELNGRVDADEGLFDFSRADAPRLDDDVLVREPGASAPQDNGNGRLRGAAPLPPMLRNARVDLALGLGPALRLRGRGLDTLLRGDLKLSSPGGRLALAGTVRTEQGSYVAYGQKMEIERGEVVFTGALDNPRLDIRAVRPQLDVSVGVAVSGTAQSPRVRLFSSPPMSDLDKLSWLVLGRASDGLGRTDTALLQRAAVALLAGEGEAPTDQLLKTLGLTDFSLRQTDGDVRETVVSLGRQLSRRWYVGYERSVNATTGTWQLVYRAAQRFTLRAQSGEENALDLIWSWRW